jgi:hypothetical protein
VTFLIAYLGEMELEGIIGTETDVQSSSEEVGKRVSLVSEEESVVRERRHGDLLTQMTVSIASE